MAKKRSNAHKRRAEREAQKKQQQRIVISVVAGVVVLLGIVGYLFVGSGAAPTVADERLELDPIRGNPDAPVTIIEYGAFGCHACQQWHQFGVIDDILEEFPNEVRFIFRDMPIILPSYSQTASEVAQCAFDQGNEQFWLMHDWLYEVAVQGGTSEIEMIQAGGNLGLDAGELRDCVDSNTHRATVNYDLERGRDLGIRGTPTWLVNGQVFYSASPETLRSAILQELGRS